MIQGFPCMKHKGGFTQRLGTQRLGTRRALARRALAGHKALSATTALTLVPVPVPVPVSCPFLIQLTKN